MKTDGSKNSIRYGLPDTVRGVLIMGMIAYHTLFDILSVFGFDMDAPWMRGVNVLRDLGAACFILLSGFCFHFGRRNARKGLLLFAAGLVVTFATWLLDRDVFVIFGVLTFMGVAKWILCGLHPLLRRVPPAVGAAVSLLLFLLFFSCNFGYVGFYGAVLFRWPSFCYRNYLTAFFGFPFNGFVSADYFGLLPWLFAALGGYFLHPLVMENPRTGKALSFRLAPAAFVGRYSLWVYLLHQPVIYFAVQAIKKLFL